MMTEIEYETGRHGLRAIVKSAWSYKIGREIQDLECVELELNHAKGWTGDDLSFLSSFSKLKSLKIIDFNIKSIEPIHTLHDLLSLEVITYCKSKIRFSEFPVLEDCALEWRQNSESLFDCIGIKKLFLNNFNGKTISQISKLQNLESLAVLNAPIESLTGIDSLMKLRCLRLANLKKLHSLAGIENLTKLEELDVHTCKKITTINEISGLSALRRLYLNNIGDIASLKPLDALANLETVIFYESTNVVDGDLSPLVRQTKLSRVFFQNRRHYSHKREEFVT